MTVLITGAAGGVGQLLLPLIKGRYRLRLTDIVELSNTDYDADDHAEFVRGDLTQPGFAAEVTSGVEAVIHLAANPDPSAAWHDLTGPNLHGMISILDAVRLNRIPRLVFASSIHAMGGYMHDATGPRPVATDWPTHPCCRYGATKVFGEAAGRVLADDSHTSVVALRLGGVRATPPTDGWLAGWLAPADLAQLMLCAIDADVRCGAYFGTSANTRSPWDLSATIADLGYEPAFDSEIYAGVVPHGDDGQTCQPAPSV